jgi:hypothetical protein
VLIKQLLFYTHRWVNASTKSKVIVISDQKFIVNSEFGALFQGILVIHLVVFLFFCMKKIIFFYCSEMWTFSCSQ